MEACEQTRFESLYAQHLRALNFDRCPDQLSTEDFKNYFASLIDTRSWSLVKIERSGLQFFYKHVLGQAWLWVDMVKAPVVKALPDVLSLEEIARIVVGTRERRYQTFCLPWQTNQQKRGGQPTAWGCV
jgi:integrase/recombinase XerD